MQGQPSADAVRRDRQAAFHASLSREFPAGSRVELAPHLDGWMQGDRFGTVVKVGKRTLTVSVKLDKSGHTRRFQPHNLQPA